MLNVGMDGWVGVLQRLRINPSQDGGEEFQAQGDHSGGCGTGLVEAGKVQGLLSCLGDPEAVP